MANHDNWRTLYPFASHYLSLGDTQLHYVDEGEGPPLLMVHGNPTWSFYWRRLLQAFRDRYRVIAVDHVGCGLSDKPQAYPYTLKQHTDNLSQLVRHLDLHDCTLIAHDWGGPIGLGAWAADQSRFGGIVLLNTGAFPPPFIPWRIRACRIPLVGTWAIRRLNLFARAALHMASAHPRAIPAAVRAGLLAPYDNWQHRVAIDRFVKDIPASPRHATWQVLAQLEERLADAGPLPVQLIWGMRDWCFRPMCLERFKTLFPEAEVHELDDASHYVVEDAGEQVVERIAAFLQQRNGQR